MSVTDYAEFMMRRIDRELAENQEVERGLAWLGLSWQEYFDLEGANPQAAEGLRERALRIGQVVA